MTPLERKFREGGGGLIARNIRGGGYGYFLEPHNDGMDKVNISVSN